MRIETNKIDKIMINRGSMSFMLVIIITLSLLLLHTDASSQKVMTDQQNKGLGADQRRFKNDISSKWPIGFPMANMNIPNAVPMEDIQRIATFQAKMTWGNVSLISTIPCCDQNDDVVALLFVFLIHSDIKPTKREVHVTFPAIQREIIKARKLYPASLSSYNKAKQEMDIRIHQTEKNNSKMLENSKDSFEVDINQPEIVSIPVTDAFIKAYTRKENLRKKMTGADRFGTVMVSARYDMIPVPVVIFGLPPLYTRSDLMQKQAKEAIGGTPTLKRIYLAGPLDQWYEFMNQEGKAILIDPRMGKTFSKSEIPELMKEGILMKGDPSTINQRWSIIKKAAEEDQK